VANTFPSTLSSKGDKGEANIDIVWVALFNKSAAGHRGQCGHHSSRGSSSRHFRCGVADFHLCFGVALGDECWWERVETGQFI
jgi:hypothetical protein